MKHAWWLIPLYNSVSKIRLYAVASDFKMYYQENACTRIQKQNQTTNKGYKHFCKWKTKI